MSLKDRLVLLVLSLAALGGGLFIAAAHPLAPVWAVLAFVGFVTLFAWKAELGHAALPALLPVLNFAPWTGWLIVDEFDLLVLAVVAAGYLRMQSIGAGLQHGRFFLFLAVTVLLAALGAGNPAAHDLDWYAGYATPMNSLRVGKSVLWTVLLLPLLAQTETKTSTDKGVTWFLCACVLGSVWVVLAACWERAFYPGLFDFATPYRTVALFWEMHQGGAALDAYLILLAPLLVWAWRAANSSVLRISVGILVLAFVYVCLTTYSRGVLGAVAGSMILLSAMLLRRPTGSASATPVFSPTSIAILLLVALEIVLVLGSDSFMNRRLAASEQDFSGRLRHWQQGISLLNSPGDWLFGIGLGRLPLRMIDRKDGPALPGSYYWRRDDDRSVMVISGPDERMSKGPDQRRRPRALYAISQRVDLVHGQRYQFAVEARGERAAQMLVQVCEQHLLYPAGCQTQRIYVATGGWHHWQSELSGQLFKGSDWRRIGHGVLMLSVLTPGARVEVSNLELSAGAGDLLRNAQFLDGAAAWFPAARSYFLPWHIDSLYLEILIETGLAGLCAFLLLVTLVVHRLFRAFRQGNGLAPYFLSSIAGLMALGLLVSVLDMPRAATLFGLFLLFAWRCSARTNARIDDA